VQQPGSSNAAKAHTHGSGGKAGTCSAGGIVCRQADRQQYEGEGVRPELFRPLFLADAATVANAAC
jgi:hypothetical protein